MLFPCILIAIFSTGTKRYAAAILSVLMLTLFVFADTPFATSRTSMLYVYFAVWSIGAMIHFIKGRKRLACGLALIVLAIIYGGLNHWHIDATFKGDWAVAALVSGFILLCTHIPASRIKGVASFFAGYSYSLYAIHLPVIVLMLSFDPYLKTTVPFTLMAIGRFIGYVLLTNFCALVFWNVFERHTQQVRHWTRKIPVFHSPTTSPRYADDNQNA